MTPELRHSVASRARALQDRLNQFSVGAVEAATEAMRIFEDAADEVRCRWLALELRGYAEHVDSRALHQVLGVPQGHQLAVHWEAFDDVSALEESIAALVPPDDIEGEIARLGAVTAALSAGEPLRALQLAERFLSESLAPEIAEKLRQLVTEADAELVRAATDEPTVVPVMFTLRAA